MVDKRKYTTKYLILLLAFLCGIGSEDGVQERWSRGEPFNKEADFPSPILFHTRAVGHSSVIT